MDFLSFPFLINLETCESVLYYSFLLIMRIENLAQVSFICPGVSHSI